MNDFNLLKIDVKQLKKLNIAAEMLNNIPFINDETREYLNADGMSKQTAFIAGLYTGLQWALESYENALKK